MASDPFIDDTLGPLAWDEELEEWIGEVELDAGRQIRIHVSTIGDDIPSLPIVMDQARRSLELVRREEESFRHSAAGDLLAIHNNSWNDEEPIDENRFIDRMALKSVTFYPDGSTELFYADGDLFWGHAILLSIAANGTVGKATIAG